MQRSWLRLLLVPILTLVLVVACSGQDPTLSAGTDPAPTEGTGAAVTPVPGATPVGDDGATGATGSAGDGCVTVPTTVPGMEFCEGYDPTAGQAPGPVECPAAQGERPAGGWLDPAGQPQPGVGGGVVAAESPELEALVELVVAELGSGYRVVDRRSLVVPDCPEVAPHLTVELADDQGATVWVATRRLTGPLDWSQVPVAGDVLRAVHDDGTEMASNDFNGEGVYRRVLAARPDGSFVWTMASGADAPSQSGWPTTMPTMPLPPGQTAPAPGPAPLTLGQLQALALAILG